VNRAISAVSVCLCLLPAGAWALDWSVDSTLSQSVELNNNLYLRSMLAGGVFGSYSTITADATARTPTSVFNFDGSVNYRKYVGPGTEGVSQTESLSGSMRGHYETKENTPGDRSYLDVSWNRQNTSLALLGDLGVITNQAGSIDRTTVGGGIDRSLSNLDTLSLSARTAFTSYEPAAGGTAFSDTTADASWRHKVSSVAALIASSDIEWLSFDSVGNQRTLILRENAGVTADISPRLSFRGTAGVAYVQAEGAGAASILPSSTGLPSTSGATSGSSTGFITDLLLTYKMFKDTTLTLSGSRSISPSVVGSLAQRPTARAGLSYAIDSHSSLSFATDLTQQIASGASGDYYSASVAYSYMLTREWNAQLSYRFLHRFASAGSESVLDPITGVPIASNTGPASSNSILLAITRSVSMLPNGY
jgi:hypothetical protein